MVVWPPNSGKSVINLQALKFGHLEQVGPSSHSEFLGFGITTIKQELQLLQDKVTIHSAITEILHYNYLLILFIVHA